MRTRLLKLGVDSAGRSCIAHEGDIDARAVAPGAATTIASLFSIPQSPPPRTLPGQGRFRPDVLDPGHVSWYIVDHPPHTPDCPDLPPQDLHHRNVIDCLFIFEGSAQLVLGDGAHRVGAGDCIVMEGNDHAFRPDPGGCRLMAFAIGTPPA
jgi:mannose-6-phosphate isomerase-like protein (cupin superfamily)